MVEKKDYSNSGVNLCNPPEVRKALDLYQTAQNRAWGAQEVIEAAIPDDLKAQNSAASVALGEARTALRAAVEEHGGYQDIETETYALLQTRKTAQYHAKPFMERYEQAVPMVIENAINATALKGLVKGGMLSQDDLEEHGVITYKETQAFILSLPEPKAD